MPDHYDNKSSDTTMSQKDKAQNIAKRMTELQNILSSARWRQQFFGADSMLGMSDEKLSGYASEMKMLADELKMMMPDNLAVTNQ